MMKMGRLENIGCRGKRQDAWSTYKTTNLPLRGRLPDSAYRNYCLLVLPWILEKYPPNIMLLQTKDTFIICAATDKNKNTPNPCFTMDRRNYHTTGGLTQIRTKMSQL